MNDPAQLPHVVFIDPSTEHFLEDRLFDISNQWLNRDGTLLPFNRLREQLRAQGSDVRTADFLRRGDVCGLTNHYWSLGLLDRYREFRHRKDVRLRGFFLMEPPLQAPYLYRALPELTSAFESVYVHNVIGDGYSLKGVDTSKLRQLYWPQPYSDVVEPYWSRNERQNKVVVISGNHNPRLRRPELYSKRIDAMTALSKYDAIDLYGRGWNQWWSKQSMWPTYWLNRRALMSIYRGSCESKLEVLCNYRFCLCLENMPMHGYITEKIFDCLYAGTVPLYLGAPDIEQLIPAEVYVDIRKFNNWEDLWYSIREMSDHDWHKMHEAGREFLRGVGRNTYFNSLDRIIINN